VPFSTLVYENEHLFSWLRAQLLLRLMIEDRFPRIWVPDSENRTSLSNFMKCIPTTHQ